MLQFRIHIFSKHVFSDFSSFGLDVHLMHVPSIADSMISAGTLQLSGL